MAVTRINPAPSDSGWNPVSSTPNAWYRKHGSVVFLDFYSYGDITIPAHTETHVITLPSGVRPTKEFVFPVSPVGGTAIIQATIGIDGKVILYSTTLTSYFRGYVSYPV